MVHNNKAPDKTFYKYLTSFDLLIQILELWQVFHHINCMNVIVYMYYVENSPLIVSPLTKIKDTIKAYFANVIVLGYDFEVILSVLNLHMYSLI